MLAASPRWPTDAPRVGEPTPLAFGLGLTGGTWTVDVDPGRGPVPPASDPVRVGVKRDVAARIQGEVATRRRLGPGFPGVPDMLAPDPTVAWAPDVEHPTIVLAFVADARPGDVLTGCTTAEAVAVVDAIAEVHAATWEPTGPAEPTWLPPTPDPSRWPDSLARLRTRFRLSDDSMRSLAELPDRAGVARASLAAGPRCWIHADLHLDNVLHRHNGTAVLLDWTGGRVGPPAVDLARLLVEGPLPALLTVDAIVSAWVDALARHGVGVDPVAARTEVAAALQLVAVPIVGWSARDLGDDAHPRAHELRRRAVAVLVERHRDAPR